MQAINWQKQKIDFTLIVSRCWLSNSWKRLILFLSPNETARQLSNYAATKGF